MKDSDNIAHRTQDTSHELVDLLERLRDGLGLAPEEAREIYEEVKNTVEEVRIMDEELRALRLHWLIHDVSDRRRAEEELKQANAELERRVQKRTADLETANAELRRSNQDLEQFAYVASHDLQEPLRTIASFAGLLERQCGPALDSKGREYLDYLVDGARRMQTLVKDLLEFCRVGTQARPFELVETGTVLAEVLRSLQPRIDEAKARVTVDPLPAVTADRTQLARVFQNLLSNALKFHHPDRSPEIHVGAERREKEWLFSVRDNGIGIDKQYFDRIFGMFERLHTRHEYPGTGIGLAIVKRIIERHHGRVCVESKPGEGSTFYFTLPAKA